MNPTLDDRKTALRRELRARRCALAGGERPRAALQAVARLLEAPELVGARVVAAFRGIRDEIDTGPLIGTLRESGRMVVLPRVVGRGQPLAFHLWRPGDDLEEVAMGVLQPRADSPGLVPDLVVAPLLGFDGLGRRLGYGGGFYDRTLALLRRDRPTPAIGFAFELQRIDEVPTGPSDQPLDRVATELALHDCRCGT